VSSCGAGHAGFALFVVLQCRLLDHRRNLPVRLLCCSVHRGRSPCQKQCFGHYVQTCDETSTWRYTSQCEGNVCVGNACIGTCLSGSARCDGKARETCDSKGDWVTQTICPFICTGGACAGTCAPDTLRCSPSEAAIQTCNAQGQWLTTSTCPYPGNATPTCAGGFSPACGFTCNPGAFNCDGNPANGCEALCSALNGVPSCSGGACAISCNPGFADCSPIPGRETPLGSVYDCLGRGDSCGPNPANAMNVCNTATGCGFVCNSGFQDCDGNPTNGCEAHLLTPPVTAACVGKAAGEVPAMLESVRRM